MKKLLIILCLSLFSCAVSKITNTQIYNLDDKIVSINIHSDEPLYISKKDSFIVYNGSLKSLKEIFIIN